MKKITKLFITCLLAFLMVFGTSFTVFADDSTATAEETEGYTEYITEIMEEIISMSDVELEETINTFISYGFYDFADGLSDWKSMYSTLGELVEVKNVSGTYSDDGYSIIMNADVVFKNATVKATMTYDYSQGGLVNIAFAKAEDTDNSTLGEKIKDASVNLVVGMGTVFAVLIFLCGVIYLFKYISKAEKAIEDKKNAKKKAAKKEEAIPEIVSVTPTPSSNDELQAVIAAAIAAYESDNGSKIKKQSSLRNGINIQTYRRK